MKGKRKLLIIASGVVLVGLMLFTLFMITTYPTQPTQSEHRAEQIILSYISEKNLNIKPGTNDYRKMMKGILLGEYPDLTSENSLFVKNASDRDDIISYAAMSGDELKGGN